MSYIVFLVREEKVGDIYIDAKRYRRFDVIAALPEGHEWGRFDLTEKIWRILHLPQVPLDYAEMFLAEELDNDPGNPSEVLQIREFMFDLDSISLSAGFRRWLEDDTRAQPIRTSNWTPDQIEALRKPKERLVDPRNPGLDLLALVNA